MGSGEKSVPALAARASDRLNWIVERVCAVLAAVLVLDVWLGVLVRYVVPWQLTFTEEAARYLMIWTALLAISCGIARREHIGVLIIFEKLPSAPRRVVLALLDLLALGFFLYLLYFGIGFVESGLDRFTMIYGMNKALPFAAVPVAAALAAVQLVLVAIRDQATQAVRPGEGQA
jgi:TRAP-type C4-dicarboxylate transport system permease small subunit